MCAWERLLIVNLNCEFSNYLASFFYTLFDVVSALRQTGVGAGNRKYSGVMQAEKAKGEFDLEALGGIRQKIRA